MPEPKTRTKVLRWAASYIVAIAIGALAWFLLVVEPPKWFIAAIFWVVAGGLGICAVTGVAFLLHDMWWPKEAPKYHYSLKGGESLYPHQPEEDLDG